MKKTTSNGTKLLLVAIALGTAGAPGCKSLSWKPGGKLFAWNRQPESESLALPESPATKYSPDAIASIGSQPTGGAKTAGTGSASSSAYGYTAGNNSAAGLAAKANGYQTGPYQVGGAKPATGTTAAKSQSSVNPYGGSYGKLATATAGSKASPPSSSASTPKTPDISLPSSVQAALAANKSAPANQPVTQVSAGSSATLPTIPVSGSTSAYSSSNLPKYPQIPSQTGVAGTPASANGYQGTTTLGQNPVAGAQLPGQSVTAGSGATSSSAIPTGLAGTVSNAGQTSTGQATSNIPAMPGGVQKAESATAAFAPGTTGRSTKYNFGK